RYRIDRSTPNIDGCTSGIFSCPGSEPMCSCNRRISTFKYIEYRLLTSSGGDARPNDAACHITAGCIDRIWNKLKLSRDGLYTGWKHQIEGHRISLRVEKGDVDMFRFFSPFHDNGSCSLRAARVGIEGRHHSSPGFPITCHW